MGSPCNNMEMSAQTVAMPPHDYDWVRFKVEGNLPEHIKDRFDGGSSTFRGGVCVRWTGKLGPDIAVFHYPKQDQVVVSGSPHKLVRGESVGQFGPAEMKRYAEHMAGSLGLPADVVLNAPVSRFDLAANMGMDAAPAEYIRIMSPPKRMRAVGSGSGSTAFKNSVAELIIYDKIQKIRDKKAWHTLPDAWKGRHVLRVEARFKKPRKEFGRALRVSDLCDGAFYVEAVERWLHRVDQIVLSGETVPVPLAPTKREMVEGLARIGMGATGGATAMAERIKRGQRLGVIEPHNARREMEWVVVLTDTTMELVPNLSAEFARRALEAAQRSVSHCVRSQTAAA